MSLNKPGNSPTESSNNIPEDDQVAQIEAKHFYRPDEDDSATFDQIQSQVDRCRVFTRGGFNAFLVGNSLGQLLVEYVAPDPMVREKELRMDNVAHYSDLLHKSGIITDPKAATDYAKTYYEVLPLERSVTIFQLKAQELAEIALAPFFLTGKPFDLINGYQNIKKTLNEHSNYSEDSLSEADAQQIIYREFIWKIKIHLAFLFSQEKHTSSILVMSIFNSLDILSIQEGLDLWTNLPLEIQHFSKRYSQKPAQRNELAHFCLYLLCSTGLNQFHRFSDFLLAINVKKIEGEELTNILEKSCLEDLLDEVWSRDKKSYFQIIEYLVELEIHTPAYLNSDKMLHRSIEYYLVSFYNGEYNNLQKDILPYLLKLGIFPEKPSDPRQNDSLLNQYDSLCARLNLEKDNIILQNYSRPKKPDKYRQGIDEE